MIKLEFEHLSKLSFPDFNILKINLNFDEKKMVIFVDGACLDDQKGVSKQLGKGELRFSNWQSFSVRLFNHESNTWIFLPDTNLELLKDICEFQHRNDIFYLRGFGIKSGRWLEYKIEHPHIDFRFDKL